MKLKSKIQKPGKTVSQQKDEKDPSTKKARLNKTMMDEQWKKHPGGG